MKKTIIRIYLTAVIVLLSSHLIYSQQNILYFMDGIHQSSELNPAYQSSCNGYLALPVISGINVGFSNTGFTYNDLIRPGTGLQKDSLIIDIDNVKSKLADNNYFIPELNIALLGVGFWAGNSYFTFSITNKTKSYFAYTDDLIKITDGNANYLGRGNPLTLSGLGPHLINYHEIALGISRKITHRLTLGARMKVLLGNVAISKNKSDIKLYTLEEENNHKIELVTDIKFNVSAPLEIKKDDEGKIDDVEFDDDNLKVFSTKNKGLAFDFGATYQLNDKIKLYASVTDLGYIKWKNNTYSFYQEGKFEFEGLSLDSVWSDSDYDLAQEMQDSISDFFEINDGNEKFTTWLNTNIFIGGSYEVIKGINIGVLSKTLFYNKKLHQGLILSANFQPTKWFSGSLSYSMINRSYANFGMGLGIKLANAQIYMLTDYLSSFKIKDAKSVGFQFGINLYFGCKRRNKKPALGVDNYMGEKNSFM